MKVTETYGPACEKYNAQPVQCLCPPVVIDRFKFGWIYAFVKEVFCTKH
jgi:hypothetical protein